MRFIQLVFKPHTRGVAFLLLYIIIIIIIPDDGAISSIMLTTKPDKWWMGEVIDSSGWLEDWGALSGNTFSLGST